MDTVLVTGATGTTSAPLLRELATRDVRVRALVRREAAELAAPVAEVAVADLDDAAAVAHALDGVDRAYLVTPSSERAQEQQLRFVELAAQAGVGHVVKLSQLGADEGSPVRYLRYHAVVERRIRELGLGFTFLRPNLFLQGLLAFADVIRAQGVLAAPIGDARVSLVDVRDIAAVAAAALTEPGHGSATYTITGPAAVTHAEIAAELTAATGRPIGFADVDPEVFAGFLRGVLPDWQVEGTVEDYAHYSRGEAAEVTSAVPDVTGAPARGVAAFVREHAAAFAA